MRTAHKCYTNLCAACAGPPVSFSRVRMLALMQSNRVLSGLFSNVLPPINLTYRVLRASCRGQVQDSRFGVPPQ